VRASAASAGLFGLLALCCAPAAAQPAPAKAPPLEAAPPVEAPPPYEPQLLRLAELMGALAYLRELCADGDANVFHDKMTALLDAEAKTQNRRDSLAGAYNRSFRDYEISYRNCTPPAREIISRFLAETARLTADLASRYGG
jgi:uncharacterized protein (TIGR02301 family)